jgi:hypothetical protein
MSKAGIASLCCAIAKAFGAKCYTSDDDYKNDILMLQNVINHLDSEIIQLKDKLLAYEPEIITSLPYPEEQQDLTSTIDNIKVEDIRQSWYENYNVPDIYREFWDGIKIIVSMKYPYPACNEWWNKAIYVQPSWCNQGVIAHEAAHTVWFSLLTPEQQEEFIVEYKTQLTLHKYLIYLDSVNSYMNTNIAEAHAEIYRYLGKWMPPTLKQYYPKLF